MTDTEHALRGPFYLLERRHGLAHPSAEILDRPVDVLPAGSNRHTPLHEAVSTNPDDESVLHGIRLVRILLDNGADVTAATHTEGHVPGRLRMRGITPIDEVYEEDPRMRKLFRKHFAIVVRRCAFRGLPADLASHVASFLMPDVAWFLM